MAGAMLQFVGHATVRIDLDGTCLLTDPVLRNRTAGLVHRRPPSTSVFSRPVDGVLISHLHHDHLDLGSLRLLQPGFQILIAAGGADLLGRHGFDGATDMHEGDATRVGNLRITATRADHKGYRVPVGPLGDTIGFIVEGSLRIYFAGDTDVFDEMSRLQPIDLALLPVAGWGPRLGPGHMDSARAVEALRLLQPRMAVPIHWGTLAPWGLHRGSWSYLTRPAQEFAELAARETPQVEVRVLQPGEKLSLSLPHVTASSHPGN
jgi:L-ascorbate metabolism protein UlaG (beta-lactamase superfamily)